MTAAFELDPRLAASSALIVDWPVGQLRLRDDRRFAWLLLVPRRPGIVEFTDLDDAVYAALAIEIRAATRLVQQVAAPEKLNVAMIGNIVAQMHIHIVGRRRDDPAWPGTVWAAGDPVAFAADELAALVRTYRAAAATIADRSPD